MFQYFDEGVARPAMIVFIAPAPHRPTAWCNPIVTNGTLTSKSRWMFPAQLTLPDFRWLFDLYSQILTFSFCDNARIFLVMVLLLQMRVHFPWVLKAIGGWDFQNVWFCKIMIVVISDLLHLNLMFVFGIFIHASIVTTSSNQLSVLREAANARPSLPAPTDTWWYF